MRVFSLTLGVLMLLWTSLAINLMDMTESWENSGYHRAIDVLKSYVKERHDITAKNIGTEPSDKYVIGFPRDIAEDITLMVAMANSLQGKKSLLKTVQLDYLNEDDKIAYYAIGLPYPVAPQSEIAFTVSLIVTNQFYPVPQKLSLDADQTVRLDTVYYPLSPYDTLNYSFGFLGTKEYDDVTSPLPDLPIELTQSNEESRVYFTASEVIPPNSYFKLVTSFIKNDPLKYVNYLKRDLWVSHWSNALELEEYYELTNKGAELESGFNRAEWFNGRYALKRYFGIENLRIQKPDNDISYDSIYFKDKVGNVSTSQVFDDEIIIKPRFPIFGNWNYNFTIGWNYKLDEFLKSDGDEYILKVRVLDGILDTTYEKISLNIYLPEGAEFIDYGLPFGSAEPKISNVYSYMDYSTGHVRVEFDFENLVDELKTFQVVIRYKYTFWAMIQKPLTCAKYIFLALLAIYALKKVDLSITQKEGKALNQEDQEKEQSPNEPVTKDSDSKSEK